MRKGICGHWIPSGFRHCSECLLHWQVLALSHWVTRLGAEALAEDMYPVRGLTLDVMNDAVRLAMRKEKGSGSGS